MTKQIAIPCTLMRGGTSKGVFFRTEDLPAELERRNQVILAIMGSPDSRQIDGLGGAKTLSSKVAMVSASKRPGVDVDYLFAQVAVDQAIVDTAPSCGNMLAAVGPFAIEVGLVPIAGARTPVVIFDINTQSRIEAVVDTSDGEVVYDGETTIDGVPGTAAEIRLNFMDIAGSKTGKLLPTGKRVEQIDGIDVTLIDVAVPMMILRATDIGKTGYETPAELDADRTFFARMEMMRLEAGRRMGLGDATGIVVPKMAILAQPKREGTIAARYFVPNETHAAFAVTGGLCVATCAMLPGSVSDGLARRPDKDNCTIVIEHPRGILEIALQLNRTGALPEIIRGGVARTARKLMSGMVYIPQLKKILSE